jgi:hypothetical protein
MWTIYTWEMQKRRYPDWLYRASNLLIHTRLFRVSISKKTSNAMLTQLGRWFGHQKINYWLHYGAWRKSHRKPIVTPSSNLHSALFYRECPPLWLPIWKWWHIWMIHVNSSCWFSWRKKPPTWRGNKWKPQYNPTQSHLDATALYRRALFTDGTAVTLVSLPVTPPPSAWAWVCTNNKSGSLLLLVLAWRR